MRGWLVPPSAPHLHRRHLGIPGSSEPAPKFVGSPLVQPPAHPLSTELPCCTYSVRHKSAPPNSWTLRPRVPAALPVISSPHGEFLFINEMLFQSSLFISSTRRRRVPWAQHACQALSCIDSATLSRSFILDPVLIRTLIRPPPRDFASLHLQTPHMPRLVKSVKPGHDKSSFLLGPAEVGDLTNLSKVPQRLQRVQQDQL